MLLALFLCLCSVVLTYFYWSRKVKSALFVGCAVFILWSGALWFLISVKSVEFGAIYLLLFLMSVFIGMVLINSERWNIKSSLNRQSLRFNFRSWIPQAINFLTSIVLPGVAAVLTCVWVGSLLSWSVVDKAALVVLVVPVFWGLASFWMLFDARKSRPMVSLSSLTVTAAIFLFS